MVARQVAPLNSTSVHFRRSPQWRLSEVWRTPSRRHVRFCRPHSPWAPGRNPRELGTRCVGQRSALGRRHFLWLVGFGPLAPLPEALARLARRARFFAGDLCEKVVALSCRAVHGRGMLLKRHPFSTARRWRSVEPSCCRRFRAEATATPPPPTASNAMSKPPT